MRVGLAAQGGRNTKGISIIALGANEVIEWVVKLAPRIVLPEPTGDYELEGDSGD